MKKILFGILFPIIAFADVQVNQQQRFIHAPFSAEDTDRELYINYVRASAPIDGDIDILIWQQHKMLCETVPEEMDLPLGQWLDISSNDVDENCAITDVNGTQYEAPIWRVTHSPQTECEKGYQKFRTIVRCQNGAVQE